MFQNTDDYLAEGLAQYYTYTFISHVSDYNPMLLESFETLLKELPPPYSKFQNWLHHNSYEAVSRAFIEMRRRKLSKIEDFDKILLEAKEVLSRKNY